MDQSNSSQNSNQPAVPGQNPMGMGTMPNPSPQIPQVDPMTSSPIPQFPTAQVVSQVPPPVEPIQSMTPPPPVQDFSQPMPSSPGDPSASSIAGATTITPQADMGNQTLQNQKSGGSGKKVIFLILGILCLLGIGAAVYFFVLKKQPAEPITVNNTTPSPAPILEQELVEKEVGETPEEQEVIDIEEMSVDEEFKSIDQDLQKL